VLLFARDVVLKHCPHSQDSSKTKFVSLAVALEAVGQIWQPPYQSEIWYGATNLLKFGQLIIRKIIKIVVNRCQI